MDEVLKFAQDLISIPSVTGNELAVSDYLIKEFSKLGCTTKRFEVEKNRYNIFTAFEGKNKNDFGVIFYGHFDTVLPYNMKNPFDPKIDNGFLYGRGSVDQKGGIASVLSAFKKLSRDGESFKNGIGFLGVVDEEEEHRGIMGVDFSDIQVKNVVVTEPSGLKIGIGCKGTVPIKITVHGKSAHGCRPWLGKNAVLHCIRIIDDLFNEKMPTMSIKNIGKVKSTLSLGVMQGGKAYNIVPDTCTAFFDRRIIPGEDQLEILEKIKIKLVKYEQEYGIKVDAVIDRPDWHWEPVRNRGLKPALVEINSKIVKLVKEVHFDIIGRQPTLFFTDGYHEGDFFINEMKIDTVQYGPGDSAYAHTDDERVAIDELKNATKIYYKIAKELSR